MFKLSQTARLSRCRQKPLQETFPTTKTKDYRKHLSPIDAPKENIGLSFNKIDEKR